MLSSYIQFLDKMKFTSSNCPDLKPTVEGYDYSVKFVFLAFKKAMTLSFNLVLAIHIIDQCNICPIFIEFKVFYQL